MFNWCLPETLLFHFVEIQSINWILIGRIAIKPPFTYFCFDQWNRLLLRNSKVSSEQLPSMGKQSMMFTTSIASVCKTQLLFFSILILNTRRPANTTIFLKTLFKKMTKLFSKNTVFSSNFSTFSNLKIFLIFAKVHN